MYKSQFAALFFMAFAAIHGGESQAQSTYPNKPITIIIPFAAGGPGDSITRVLANELSRNFGQSVVVENRTGASGNIGTGAVAKATPDGYTILVTGTHNFVINQYLYRDMGFDPLESLEPVSMLVDIPLVLFLNGQMPTPTFSAFIEYARANRGKLNYTSPGIGTTLHLATEVINKRYDLRMTHVPFRGASQAMPAMLGNEVQVFLVGAGVGAQHTKAGKLHAVAAFNATRIGVLPAIPTAREVGLGDMQANNWWAVAVPKGTPAEIIRTLNARIRQALASPAMLQLVPKLGAIPIGGSPLEMGQRLREEASYWRKAIQELNLKID